ncbi:MAG: hypothetical protein IMY76_08445 [Chloroflexi bacterium]|nr:hypothetical protein [Chloroflexota bacterium]
MAFIATIVTGRRIALNTGRNLSDSDTLGTSPPRQSVPLKTIFTQRSTVSSLSNTARLSATLSPSPKSISFSHLTAAHTQIPATDILWISPPLRIGYSVAGRPIEVYRFGIGKTERMIVAGVHGGYEWNTIALADELINYFWAHPEAIPINTRLYILRALNPDGEIRSHSFDGRANDNGVDINRNFPTYWQATWPREGCWDQRPITAGEFAASEPETMALINFIEAHPIDALLSYHSAALGIFPGGRPPDAASIDLAETIAAVSSYPYPPIDLGCLMTGQMADWASINDIAAVDVELSNHKDTDFEQNLVIISAFLNWQR